MNNASNLALVPTCLALCGESLAHAGSATEAADRAARGEVSVVGVDHAFPDGRIETVKGVIEGRLAHEPKGENGFGYDPIFYYPERGMTTGEMEPEEKNAISHRGQAVRKMVELLKSGR